MAIENDVDVDEGVFSWDQMVLFKNNLLSGIQSTAFEDCLDYDQEDYEEETNQFHPCFSSPFFDSFNHSLGYFIGPETDSSDLSLGFNSPEIPDELTQINMTNLIAYSTLFPFAAIGNLLVVGALFRSRHRKSRVNLMIFHLSLADMIVTFIFLPMEITWQVSIQWQFGNVGCKVYKFFSAFGFYMSSMVLVCISLDRYFAVLHPLKVNDAQRRGKIMLLFAWIISAFISLPQVSDEVIYANISLYEKSFAYH